jgi:general L-amino acid transport system substrate-binding protein
MNKITRLLLHASIALFAAASGTAHAVAGDILVQVKSRGTLRCGVSEGIAGFSVRDSSGRWTGLDADFCRAVAAAALGSAEKVEFVPLSAAARFPALISGQVDLLVRNTTWTLGREANLGVHFAGTLYYDGGAIMVPRKSGISSIAQLKGAMICVEKGTTYVEHLADYFGSKKLAYQPLIIESLDSVTAAFFSGRCQAYVSDRTQLAAIRARAPGGPNGYIILPDNISKEPLGPVVRRGDEQWLTLVEWVLFTLIEAEELGITRENVRSIRDTKANPGWESFLASSKKVAKALGVNADWVVQIIASVGNYGEMYERNFGRQSGLPIERGLNRLWTQGGLMYAPPFR